MNSKDKKIFCLCTCIVMTTVVFAVSGNEIVLDKKKCGGEFHEECGCMWSGRCTKGACGGNLENLKPKCFYNCDSGTTTCVGGFDLEYCKCTWSCGCPWKSDKKTHYVFSDAPDGGNGSYSNPYNLIQDAINDAISGDTVIVLTGTYLENLVINTADIELFGYCKSWKEPDCDLVSIDGGSNGNVVTINADGVSISGFVIKNSGTNEEDAGIDVTSDNNNIHNNVVENSQNGIYLHDSANNNNLYYNEVQNNEWGIFIWESSDNNIIHHNDLINNDGFHAKDKSTNTWDDGSGGNYWDDYTGTDSDSDGIGDTPYMILGGSNQDGYPFMQPHGWNKPPETPTITGPTTGTPDEHGYVYPYNIGFKGDTDPGSDDLQFGRIEWGDESEQQIGPFSPNTEVTIDHLWTEEGVYTIRVKAIDEYGAESEWATLEVNMPKNKHSINLLLLTILEQLIEKFPVLEPILDYII